MSLCPLWAVEIISLRQIENLLLILNNLHFLFCAKLEINRISCRFIFNNTDQRMNGRQIIDSRSLPGPQNGRIRIESRGSVLMCKRNKIDQLK